MFKLLTLTTLSIALLLSSCASGGAIEVKNDPFVGQRRSFSLSLDGGNWNAIDVDEAQGKFTVEVRVAQPGASLNIGRPGDKGEFAVGNQILTFENTAEVRPSTIELSANSFLTFWKAVFKLDRQQASGFGTAPLRAVKIMVGAEPFQVEPNAERGAKFQQNMATLTAEAAGAPAK